MPELDGFEVLKIMAGDAELKHIPVMVMTAENEIESQTRALDCGAVDVIAKPFNARIMIHRIRNIIVRRETEKLEEQNRLYRELLNQSEIDDKTGIFNKKSFCRRTAQMLLANPETAFAVVRWDVDRFKIFNDTFGVAAGDAFLKAIGKIMVKNCRPLMTYGRLEADHFAMCVSISEFEPDRFLSGLTDFISGLHNDFKFIVRVGAYAVTDRTLDVSLMCDRAMLALRSIKYNYMAQFAWYDESMMTNLALEQQIVGEMNSALDGGSFVVYYQPQYNYLTGALIGAEALVRWKHPEKGLISPASFIPIFERNGFISKLDAYVCEKVCAYLRKMLDSKINIVPISVNISRRDIYKENLCGELCELMKKYALEPKLLRLEITESAYMDYPEQLIRTVKALRKCGFRVEMDDFGSGYSSLNSLKDVEVDTLKLDMKLLDKTGDLLKRGAILNSIVTMAHSINLPVIAEGIEKREEAEYLKRIGCRFMQGFLFSTPVPEDKFTALIQNVNMSSGDKESPICGVPDVSDVYRDLVERVDGFTANIPAGVAVYRYDTKLYPLYISGRTFSMFGYEKEAGEASIKYCPDVRLGIEDEILAAAEQNEFHCKSYEIPKLRAYKRDGSPLWLRLIFSVSDKKYYAAVFDITSQMAENAKIEWHNEKYRLICELDGVITFDYVPRCDMMTISMNRPKTGYAEEKICDYIKNFRDMSHIVPEYREMVSAALKRACEHPGEGSCDFKADFKGSINWYRAKYISVSDVDGSVYRLTGRLDNIDDMVQKQDEMKKIAQTDRMTGLLQKESATVLIDRILSDRPSERFDVLLFMDIDNFKGINDRCGHLKGDEALIKVGRILHSHFRSQDVTARFGGDEFLIYMQDAGNRRMVVNKTIRLLERLRRIKIDEYGQLSCSIGIVEVGADDDYVSLLNKSDKALYLSKSNGKNRYTFYDA